VVKGANSWLYALACVVVPVLWGLVIVWGVDRLQSRMSGPRGDEDEPVSPEYHI
jgi:hypothetical protein